MRRRLVAFSVAFVLAGVLAGCRSVAPGDRTELLPPALPAGAANFSDVEISRARNLYVAKCAKCHEFYNPANYTLKEWQSWMVKMSRKSRLDPEQEDLLSRYLAAFRPTVATEAEPRSEIRKPEPDGVNEGKKRCS